MRLILIVLLLTSCALTKTGFGKNMEKIKYGHSFNQIKSILGPPEEVNLQKNTKYAEIIYSGDVWDGDNLYCQDVKLFMRFSDIEQDYVLVSHKWDINSVNVRCSNYSRLFSTYGL